MGTEYIQGYLNKEALAAGAMLKSLALLAKKSPAAKSSIRQFIAGGGHLTRGQEFGRLFKGISSAGNRRNLFPRLAKKTSRLQNVLEPTTRAAVKARPVQGTTQWLPGLEPTIHGSAQRIAAHPLRWGAGLTAGGVLTGGAGGYMFGRGRGRNRNQGWTQNQMLTAGGVGLGALLLGMMARG